MVIRAHALAPVVDLVGPVPPGREVGSPVNGLPARGSPGLQAGELCRDLGEIVDTGPGGLAAAGGDGELGLQRVKGAELARVVCGSADRGFDGGLKVAEVHCRVGNEIGVMHIRVGAAVDGGHFLHFGAEVEAVPLVFQGRMERRGQAGVCDALQVALEVGDEGQVVFQDGIGAQPVQPGEDFIASGEPFEVRLRLSKGLVVKVAGRFLETVEPETGPMQGAGQVRNLEEAVVLRVESDEERLDPLFLPVGVVSGVDSVPDQGAERRETLLVGQGIEIAPGRIEQGRVVGLDLFPGVFRGVGHGLEMPLGGALQEALVLAGLDGARSGADLVAHGLEGPEDRAAVGG